MQVVVGTKEPFHVAYKGKKGSLVNMDTTTNAILVGYEMGTLFPGNPDTFILGALNSGYSDGSQDMWAIALANPVAVDFMEGLVDWQPSPAQVAAQVAATGVNLLSAASLLVNQASQNVAASSTFTVPGGPFPIKQIGYNAFMSVQANAGSSTPNGYLTLTWTDSVSGNIVSREIWTVTGAAAPNRQGYVGSGPTKGDLLSVTFTNLDTPTALQFVFSFTQNGRVYSRDDFRQLTTFAMPTGAGAIPLASSIDVPGNLLGNNSQAIASGITDQFLLGLYAGKAQFTFSGTVKFTVLVESLDGPTIPSTIYENINTTATAVAPGLINADITLPRGQSFVQITNNDTSTGTFTFAVVLEELPS